MKNALTTSEGKRTGAHPTGGERVGAATGRAPLESAVSEPWREALRTFDADLQRRGSAERTRKAYGTDAAELAAWATANQLSPQEVDYKALRRWGARPFQKGSGPRSTAR